MENYAAQEQWKNYAAQEQNRVTCFQKEKEVPDIGSISLIMN